MTWTRITLGEPELQRSIRDPHYPDGRPEYLIPFSSPPPELWRRWFDEVANHVGVGRVPQGLQLFPLDLLYDAIRIAVPEVDLEQTLDHLQRRVEAANDAYERARGPWAECNEITRHGEPCCVHVKELTHPDGRPVKAFMCCWCNRALVHPDQPVLPLPSSIAAMHGPMANKYPVARDADARRR